jgi:hypothetical protein
MSNDAMVTRVLTDVAKGQDPSEAMESALVRQAMTALMPSAPGLLIGMLMSRLWGDSVNIQGPGPFAHIQVTRVRETSDAIEVHYRDANKRQSFVSHSWRSGIPLRRDQHRAFKIMSTLMGNFSGLFEDLVLRKGLPMQEAAARTVYQAQQPR